MVGWRSSMCLARRLPVPKHNAASRLPAMPCPDVWGTASRPVTLCKHLNYACIMAAGSPPRVVQALDDAYSRLQELMPVEFPAAQSGASKTRRHDARLAGGGQTPTRCWAISRGEGAARAGVRTSRPAERGAAGHRLYPIAGILDTGLLGYWILGRRAPRMRTASGHLMAQCVTAGGGRVP